MLQEFPFVPLGSGTIRVLTEKSISSEVTEVEFERVQNAVTYHNVQYSPHSQGKSNYQYQG